MFFNFWTKQMDSLFEINNLKCQFYGSSDMLKDMSGLGSSV